MLIFSDFIFVNIIYYIVHVTSEKKIVFFWCQKKDQNPFRNHFTIFFAKNVDLYEIYCVKSRGTNTCVLDCVSLITKIFPRDKSVFTFSQMRCLQNPDLKTPFPCSFSSFCCENIAVIGYTFLFHHLLGVNHKRRYQLAIIIT